MQKLKNFFFLILGVAIIVWSFYTFLQQPAPEKYQKASTWQGETLKVGGKVIEVEIADSDKERAKGLSGRESLASGRGMLFAFSKPEVQGFWMYDMRFPIDMVWIDEKLNVVGVERGVKPETFPKIFYSPGPVLYVLELPAGDAAAFDIEKGTALSLE